MDVSHHILLVDDEQDLLDLVGMNLEKSGFRVSLATNGRDALKAVAHAHPDLIVLDIMMPELSGTEVVGRLKRSPDTAGIPIILLTAKAEEVDEIVGLTLGADDYITKPFSIKVLLARIDALLRRRVSSESPAARRSMGAVELDTDSHEVFVDGAPVRLTLTEFRILEALMGASGKVLSRQSLISTAIGPGISVTERTIDVHVTSIRKKLDHHAEMIQTVRGVGYRAIEPGGVLD